MNLHRMLEERALAGRPLRVALIGAGGLGSPVILGLNTLDIGRAVVGGLGIVLMAIVLDRITQSMAQKK